MRLKNFLLIIFLITYDFWPFWSIFGQNLNFMDEYLENGNFFGHAVFARTSESISSTFWSILSKIVRAVFEKKSKKCHFDHIFVLYGWTGVFFKNPAVAHLSPFWYLTTCKVSEKSLEPFPRTFHGRTDWRAWLHKDSGRVLKTRTMDIYGKNCLQ